MTKQSEAPFEGERTNPFQSSKFPGMDMKDLLSITRRNMELMSTTQEVSSEAARALVDLHNKYMRKVVDHWNDQVKHALSKEPLEEKASRQSEDAKAATDRFIQYAQDISSIVTKSHEKLRESFQENVKGSMETSQKQTQKNN